MDGAAATATIEVLVKTLINVCKEEIELNRGLEENADKLGKTLGMMQRFMDDAQTKVINKHSVQEWLKELETSSFDADNVMDELNYQFLSKNVKKIIQTAEKKKIPSCFPFFKHYARRRQMALRVEKINATFESLDKKAARLGLERTLADAPVAADVATPETNSFTLDPIFIGRDKDVSEIVKMLTTCQTEQVVSVLPIVGMGGMGKTTLTRNVFHHQNIKAHFGVCIWVHVGKAFDQRSLFKKVLTNLKPQKVDEETNEAILKKLQEALGEKTYLLVLDDVWNEDKPQWEEFKNSISGRISSKKGNTIIVTTRNTTVASIVKFTHPIYELQGLPEDNCWSIIKEKAFGGGRVPPGFETIGRDITRRCQGLPLAANVVGGVLLGKSEDEWRSIKDKCLSDFEEDREKSITNILKFSYDHLSSPSLKKCFAYCSIFPKGARMDKEEVIELWMAEGFFQPDDTSDMETVGEKIINLLLQNSLLQVARRDDYDNITHCSMHDLVHDLAYSVLGHEYYGHESGAVSKEKAKYLRTLSYQGKSSDIIFPDFKSLHVLTLSDEDVEELPGSIGELIHLRYLNVADTHITCLPDSIGQLYHMQTLRAVSPKIYYRKKSMLMKLPATLKYLINLRHLHVDDHTELPAELGMLTSLRTLTHFKVGERMGHRILQLGSLKNLKGKLKIHNLEKVDGKEEAMDACLSKKPNIIKLVLKWDESREENIQINDENVLEGLRPHPNLKMLKIKGFKGTRFPSWTWKMVGFKYLTEIKLLSCSECEEIPMMGHLPHLKALFLSDLKDLKSIGASFYGVDNLCSSSSGVGEEKIIVFSALKWIELSNMPNLTEWVKVEIPSAREPREVKIFPCLEYLKIIKCPKLVSAPRHEFPCLKELDIYNCDKLVCLPNLSFCNTQDLSKLSIYECPVLRELPEGLHTLSSLEVLSIKKCPDLKSIAYDSSSGRGGLTSLRNLSIEDCSGLMNLPCEMVESCAPSLERLELENLERLMNLPMIIDCLHKMQSLKTLEIVGVPKLIMTSSYTLCRLQELRLGPAASDSRESFELGVDGILQAASKSSSFSGLSLKGKEDWESLPDQIKHLTALTYLSLSNYGIEELPEWFGHLTSLELLYLFNCQKLSSVEAMRRLTNLRELYIGDCPVLKERCGIGQQVNDHPNSQWPNISHIPTIEVDDSNIRYEGRTREEFRYLDGA